MRAAAFIGIGWAALIVTASLETLVPGLGSLPVPALALLIVLYLGLSGRGGMVQLVALALALGYLVDLFSGSPRGLHALALACLMVIARGASSRLLVTSRWQEALVALFAALGCGLLLAVLAAPPEWPASDVLRLLWVTPGTALATALCAPPVFWLLRRIDRKLQPPQAGLRSAA